MKPGPKPRANGVVKPHLCECGNECDCPFSGHSHAKAGCIECYVKDHVVTTELRDEFHAGNRRSKETTSARYDASPAEYPQLDSNRYGVGHWMHYVIRMRRGF